MHTLFSRFAVGALALTVGAGVVDAAVLAPGESLNTLFFEDFNARTTSPFSITTTGSGVGLGSQSLVDLGGGNKVVQFTDPADASGATFTTITWSIANLQSSALVTRVNQVLSGPAGTSATFIFEFDAARIAASSSLSNFQGYLQFSPNDGSPPASGVGRDRFPVSMPPWLVRRSPLASSATTTSIRRAASSITMTPMYRWGTSRQPMTIRIAVTGLSWFRMVARTS